MARQTINIGTTANDRTGDPLRTAFTKINQNFVELYNNDATDFSGNYNDLSNKPNLNLYQLASTAFSGDYDDLDNKPTIPEDISDLTDTTNLIPSDVSELTDTTRIVERKYGLVRKNYVIKNKAIGSIEDGELVPQDYAYNYVDNTENTAILNFSTESANNGSFSTLFESMIFNKQSLELFITDYQGNDDVFFTKTVTYIPTDTNNYRGFSASFSTTYNTGRPTINQIVITSEAVNPSTSITQTTDDDFAVSNISGSDTVAVVTIFRGSEDPIGRGQLWEFFKEYVDLVLYTGENENTTATIKTRFYQHINTLKSKIPVLYPDFQFYEETAVTANTSVVTGGSGSGASFNLLSGRYDGESWRNGALLTDGSGYAVGNTLTILGTNLGGTSNNNATILISGVDESGAITAYTVSGTATNIWPTNSITDGGSEQYDTFGNVINTNRSTDIDYNDGNRFPSAGTANTAFGSASSYVTLYKDSIFSMVAKNADISSVYFSGTLGTDGDITKTHGEIEGVLGYRVNVGGLSVTGNWVEDRVYTVSYSYAGYDFPRTVAGSITNSDITNWDTAYSWGDHAIAGYYSQPSDLIDLESLVPDQDAVFDLGSPINTWNNLYVKFGIISPIDVSRDSTILFIANSSGDGYGYSTIEIHPDESATQDQYLIIDPTANGHIHIRAGGTQDNSQAELIIGGENSYFKVYSGLNPGTSIAANNFMWEFGSSGELYFPDGGNIRVGTVPGTSKGVAGDKAGTLAFNSSYIYYCTTNYTNGVADIWKRLAWSGDTW